MGAKEDEMECAYLLCLPQVNKEERLGRGIILVKLLLRKKSWRKTKNDLKPNTKKIAAPISGAAFSLHPNLKIAIQKYVFRFWFLHTLNKKGKEKDEKSSSYY